MGTCKFKGLAFVVVLFSMPSHSKSLSKKTSLEVLDKRVKDFVSLYSHSVNLYNQEGPLSFWKSFAYLATDEEIKYLLEATKHYPDLPELRQTKQNVIEVFYGKKLLSKITIQDFDSQIWIVDNKEIRIPLGASVQGTSRVFERIYFVPTREASFWNNFLDKLLFVQVANAGGNRNKNTPSKKRGFFSRLFGGGAHSFNGIKSDSSSSGAVSPSVGGSSHSGGGKAVVDNIFPDSDPSRAPIPPSSPTIPSQPGLSTSRNSNKFYTGNGPAGSLRVGPLKGPLGSECTIVFTRHGQKRYPGSQELTSKTGQEQAQALAFSMQDFENSYGEFDYAFHSNETRSKQTAAPVLNLLGLSPENANPGAPLGLKDFNECTSSDGISCSSRAENVFKKIKAHYCKGGNKIFITGHGEFGINLLKAMGVRSATYPDCGRPFVVAVNSTGSNQLISQPQTGADQGSKSMCNKRSSSADEV